MSHENALKLARQAVCEAQQWVDAAYEMATYPGELDEALEAYHDAASYFFELYDGEAS